MLKIGKMILSSWVKFYTITAPLVGVLSMTAEKYP